jgi:peptide/nickel transport system ATP-binding protein
MRSVSPLLEVADLVVAADGRGAAGAMALPALRLGPGEAAVLFGPSGSGKSTVLAALCGLLRRPGWTVRGRVQMRGEDVLALDDPRRQRLLREHVCHLPQDAHAALDPLAPIGDQLAQATERPLADCIAMLTRLGVADATALCARRPHAISGGQAQRVLLAIAFLRTPALVVVDEPSASLDGGSYNELAANLRALLAAGSAVLTATHDQRLPRDLGAAVYTFRDGAFTRGEPPARPWPARPPDQLGNVPVLAARGVRHAFGARTVLDGVDFSCRRGEIVAIVGESGAGKTTLVRALVGHLRPDGGAIERPPRATALQLVCQDAFASLTPGAPLRRLLAEAHAPYFDAGAGAAAVALPPALLEQPRERMSGGERRRAALLRALAVNPDVLVLDEPTASLDRGTAVAVFETLLVLQRSRALALVIVTHDLEFAHAVAHRVLILQGGTLCPAT